MKSSLQTYGRKRKETAEEKFDAIFKNSSPNEERNSNKKLKKEEPISYLSPSKQKKSVASDRFSSSCCSASAKFDALFGTPESRTKEEKNVSFQKNGSSSSSSSFLTPTDLEAAKKKESPTRNSKSSRFFSPLPITKEEPEKKSESVSTSSKLVAGTSSGATNITDDYSSSSSLGDNQGNRNANWEKSADPAADLFGFTSSLETCVRQEKVKPAGKVSSGNQQSSVTSPTMPTSLPISNVTVARIAGRLVLNIERRRSSSSSSASNGSKPSNLVFTDSSKASSIPPVDAPEKAKISTSASIKGQNDLKSSRLDDSHSSKATSIAIKSPEKRKGSISSLIRNSASSISSMKIMNGTSKNSLMKKCVSSATSKMNNGKVCYNPRPWMKDSEDVNQLPKQQPQQKNKQNLATFSKPITKTVVEKRTISGDKKIESTTTSDPYSMQHVEIVTYVKNVKNFQNVLEEGEAQEFSDEVDYVMEGLEKMNQTASVKCLLVSSFTTKCLNSSFCFYLKAHSVLQKIFPLLSDAPANKPLALATGALLYVLSRDQSSDLNKQILSLLFRLLDPLDCEKNFQVEAPTPTPSAALPKEKSAEQRKYNWRNKDRSCPTQTSSATSSSSASSQDDFTTVQQKIKEIIQDSDESVIDKNDITIKSLCSEALLRYTLRPSNPDWFREEIRLRGGLDHIISTVKSNIDFISNKASTSLPPPNEESKQQLNNETKDGGEGLFERKHFCIVNRILKVLDKGILDCPSNGTYLVTYQRALLLKSLSTMMKLCQRFLPHCPPTSVCKQATSSNHSKSPDASPNSILSEVIKQIIKLFINISNDNELVSSRIGKEEGLLQTIVGCVFDVPKLIEEKQKYEMYILSLSLIVNMVECSAANRLSFAKITVPPSSVESLKYGNSTIMITDGTDHIKIMDALIQLFKYHEMKARDNEILGQDGVKRAAQAKKQKDVNKKPVKGLQLFENGCHDDVGGHWKMSDDGLEWIPSETETTTEHQLTTNQPRKTMANSRNPESNLTTEERKEMNETLDKANDHLENTMVASYVGLVVGCMIRGNRAGANNIRPLLQPEGFKPMIIVLKKMLHFMSLMEGMSKKGEATLKEIIEDLEEAETSAQNREAITNH